MTDGWTVGQATGNVTHWACHWGQRNTIQSHLICESRFLPVQHVPVFFPFRFALVSGVVVQLHQSGNEMLHNLRNQHCMNRRNERHVAIKNAISDVKSLWKEGVMRWVSHSGHVVWSCKKWPWIVWEGHWWLNWSELEWRKKSAFWIDLCWRLDKRSLLLCCSISQCCLR